MQSIQLEEGTSSSALLSASPRPPLSRRLLARRLLVGAGVAVVVVLAAVVVAVGVLVGGSPSASVSPSSASRSSTFGPTPTNKLSLRKATTPLHVMDPTTARSEDGKATPLTALPSQPTGRLSRRGGGQVAALHVAPEGTKRDGCYIVKMRRGSSEHTIKTIRDSLTDGHDTHEHRHFTSSIEGFSLCGVSEQLLQDVRAHPMVDFVEEDAVVSISLEWGVDRIDQQRLPLDGRFNSNGVKGDGVDVYVVDTGIHYSHQEFGGRVVGGTSFVGGSYDDCAGHGTHVAATIGGATVGIAPNVQLFAVRVLDCAGSGSSSGVISGLDWVGQNVRPRRKSVVNMSLGGAVSSALDSAVRSLISSGIFVGVAAGNNGADACNSSPARVTEAITVGAVSNADALASFSNRGACVDILAPGVNIRSAWYTGNNVYNTLSGTSMATPHLVGAAALYLSAHPSASPAQVQNDIINSATLNAISGVPSGTPNKMLYILPFLQSSAPAPAPAPATTLRPTTTTTTAATTAATTRPAATTLASAPATCTGTLCETTTVLDGKSNYHPKSRSGYYCVTNTAAVSHHAILRPAASSATNTDFDLYLWGWNAATSAWVLKDSSSASGSSEEIRFTANGGGCWSWEVHSYYGTGSYTINMNIPA